MEARPSALPLLRFSCSGCGYGASARRAPTRCPMCGSEGSWVEEGWKLFADLTEATRRDETDADAPLQREAEEPTALPGVPLT